MVKKAKTGESPSELTELKKGSKKEKKPKPVTELSPFIDRFILFCKSEDYSPQTVYTYETLLGKFNWWYTECAKIPQRVGAHPSNFTEDHIREFLLYLRSDQKSRWGEDIMAGKEKLSPTTVYNYGRAVRTFFNWMKKRHIITTSPFSDGVTLVSRKDGVKRRHYNNLEDTQLNQIFRTLSSPKNLSKYNGARNFAMLALMLDSGMRMGELLSVRKCDIEWERKRVTIRGKTGERVCFYNAFVQEALDNYYYAFRGKQKDHMAPTDMFWLTKWGAAFSEGGFWHMIDDLCKESGVKFHAHQFRHTFASILAKRVSLFELKELLGHKDINVTMIYTHGSPDANQKSHMGNSPFAVLDIGKKVSSKTKSYAPKRPRGRPKGAKNIKRDGED